MPKQDTKYSKVWEKDGLWNQIDRTRNIGQDVNGVARTFQLAMVDHQTLSNTSTLQNTKKSKMHDQQIHQFIKYLVSFFSI